MDALSHRKKVTIMLALMTAMFFSAINQTLVGTAMPKIAAILGGSDQYTWVITIYMLTMTISTILVGKLSDIYGRKIFILAGIIIFMIGAFLAGFSQDIYQLITFRGVQGVGGGIIMSTVITAIGDLFVPRERGKWTGIMMASFGLSSVLGPPLGGWLVDNMAWKWLFWVFLPLGFVAFFLILILFPKIETVRREKIDYFGMLFLTLAIIALLLGFSWAGTVYDWGSLQIIGLFAATIVFLAIFVLIEAKAESPVLPLSLFRNDIVTISNCIGFIINAGMMGALIYLPFYVQGVQGISPTYSGYVTMPLSIIMVVLSTITGSLMSKTGKYKRYAIVSMPLMIAGLLIMAAMNSVWMAVVSMIVFGIGIGIASPIFTLTAQNAMSSAQLGVVTASSQLFRNLGGTIGITVMGAVMQSSFIRRMNRAAMSEEAGQFDPDTLDPHIAEVATQFQTTDILLNHPKREALLQELPEAIRLYFEQMVETLKDAFAASLSMVFLSASLLVGVAMILTFFLREIPLRTTNQMPDEEEVLS